MRTRAHRDNLLTALAPCLNWEECATMSAAALRSYQTTGVNDIRAWFAEEARRVRYQASTRSGSSARLPARRCARPAAPRIGRSSSPTRAAISAAGSSTAYRSCAKGW